MNVVINGTPYMPVPRLNSHGGNSIGGRLKAARQAERLSVDEVATICDSSHTTIRKIESNYSSGRFTTVVAMCRLYGVSMDWVVYGDEGLSNG